VAVLETELLAVLDELRPLLEGFSHNIESGPLLPLDKNSMQELFAGLEPLLESGSPESLEFIELLRRVPGSENLIEQIENYNFDMALETFNALKTREL